MSCQQHKHHPKKITVIKKNDLMWKNIEAAIEALSLYPSHQQQGAKEQPLSLPKSNWVGLIWFFLAVALGYGAVCKPVAGNFRD